MVARVLFPWLTSWGNTTTPTRGPHSPPDCVHKGPPSHSTPPSPLQSSDELCVRLMPIGADKSAMGAVNRPLRRSLAYTYLIHPLSEACYANNESA
jgi:hypothetical protein